MTPTSTCTGSCHSGTVKFSIEAGLQEARQCNCSHCVKKGFLLTVVPAGSFTLLQGADALTAYFFNSKAISHEFCSQCGVQAFASGNMPDGSPVRSINVRCPDNIDINELPVTHVDGRSL